MNQFQNLVKLIESNKDLRKSLITNLNYKDPAKGTNKLLTKLRKKTISILELKKVSEILSFNPDEVIFDYLELKKIINKEKKLKNKIQKLKYEIFLRKNFKPYIYIETSLKNPTFITGASIFINDLKYINELPQNILEISREDQVKIIKKISIENYKFRDGKCPLFGEIIGYRFFYSYDKYININLEKI